MIYLGFALPIEASETTHIEQVKSDEKQQFPITHK
jgi:hypothetical protein